MRQSRDTIHRTVESVDRTPNRLGETFERAPVGIAHFDLTGRFLSVNPMLCSIFGLSREHLLSLTFQQISFPDDLPTCLTMTTQLAAGVIPKYTLEKRFLRPDGTFVYTRVIVTAVRDYSGDVEFFLGVVEDLSEQWLIEQARRAAEERLQVALEASGTGIYRYDFQAQALDWANGLAQVFGFPADETLQSLDRLLGAIHPEDLPAVLKSYERSATDGTDFDEEFRIVLPDGSVRWICDRARMAFEDGKPRYLIGACTDITALREAQAQRERLLLAERTARTEAERAIRMRDEVMAVVAHDLRNPVHTIMMSAGAMAELDLTEADRKAQVALIRRSARGMDRLIRDLLDASQIEMGQLAIIRAPAALDTIVDDAIATTSAQASERGITVGTRVPATLPLLSADRARMVQALGNLVANAIKFTARGGRVTVVAESAGDVVEVSVSDTGCGIERGHLPHIFDRYWQADPRSRKGVGLGLSIVRGIVEAHGGSISVVSRIGAGTTFRFRLPTARDVH